MQNWLGKRNLKCGKGFKRPKVIMNWLNIKLQELGPLRYIEMLENRLRQSRQKKLKTIQKVSMHTLGQK
jgi:hypothetical protein